MEKQLNMNHPLLVGCNKTGIFVDLWLFGELQTIPKPMRNPDLPGKAAVEKTLEKYNHLYLSGTEEFFDNRVGA